MGAMGVTTTWTTGSMSRLDRSMRRAAGTLWGCRQGRIAQLAPVDLSMESQWSVPRRWYWSAGRRKPIPVSPLGRGYLLKFKVVESWGYTPQTPRAFAGEGT